MAKLLWSAEELLFRTGERNAGIELQFQEM